MTCSHDILHHLMDTPHRMAYPVARDCHVTHNMFKPVDMHVRHASEVEIIKTLLHGGFWSPQLQDRGHGGVPRTLPPRVHSLLIKFEQAGEIPPVQRPPDFVKWGLYILQLGYATSCTVPGLAPARACACDPREAGSNRGVCKGALSPRAPARLRLRRTPVAVACSEVLLLYICLESMVRCFADAILHAAGGPPFAVCGGGAAAMGCRGETRGGWCHAPCGDFSVACGMQTALGGVLVAMCVTHAATPPAH